MSRRIAIGVMILFALAAPQGIAQSTDIKFVGQSRATPQLKHDILTTVAGYFEGASFLRYGHDGRDRAIASGL